MRNLLEKYLPLFELEGGISSGGADDPGGAGGQQAEVAGVVSPAGEVYKPKGVSDSFFGETNEQTIDNMAASLQTYREKASANPVPKESSGYELGEVSGDLKPFLDNLADDPAFEAAKSMALKNELSTSQFSGFITDVVGEWFQAGLFSDVVDAEKERMELVPDHANLANPQDQSIAIDARINDNIDWVETALVGKGMAKEDAEFLTGALADRAAGHRSIEFLRNLIDGASSQPLGGGGSSDTSIRDQLIAREQDPRNDPKNPKYQPGYAAQTLEMWKNIS